MIDPFLLHLRRLGVPEPTPEHRFHETRRWRIDYAWPDHMLAVEVEGGAWVRGRHTRAPGFLRDMQKYRELTHRGWSLLRYTPQEVESGEAARDIARWFGDREGEE